MKTLRGGMKTLKGWDENFNIPWCSNSDFYGIYEIVLEYHLILRGDDYGLKIYYDRIKILGLLRWGLPHVLCNRMKSKSF